MSKHSFENRTFLIVDDENISRVSLLRMLKKMGDPYTHSATNGLEAMPILESHIIDCAILDFNMPALHGLQLLQKIRTGEATEHRIMPVIMLTAHGDAELVHIAMQLDVNAFLLKPATVDTLGDKIAQVLQMGDPLKADWIKEIEDYQAVNADFPIEELLKFQTGSVSHEEEIDTGMPDHSKMVDINDLTPGVTFALPCIDNKGHTFVRAGQVCTKVMILRMQGLVELGVIDPQVCVYDK